jgi:uncharacterized protein (TIGR00725 family)
MGPAKARRKDVENARVLGELIARREWVLLTGGRDVGVMHAASQGAKKVARSLTVGVLPTTRDKISKYVDVAIVTEMGSARNNICVFSSQVIVACGLGGSGTVSEVALALKSRRHFSKISGAGGFRAYRLRRTPLMSFSGGMNGAMETLSIRHNPGGIFSCLNDESEATHRP